MASPTYKHCRCGREYKSPEGYGAHRVDCQPMAIEPGELSPKELAAFLGEARRMAKFHADKVAGFLELAKSIKDCHEDVAKG